MILYDLTIGYLIDIGFYNILIPFVVIFTVSYKILGFLPFKKEKDKNIIIIAMACSFYLVAYTTLFYPSIFNGFINTFFGKIIMIIKTILFMALMYVESKKRYDRHKGQKKNKKLM